MTAIPSDSSASPEELAVTRLLQARRQGRLMAAPTLPDAAAAYAVQDTVAGELGWFGANGPRYWKSGGASRAVQTHAPLPPDGIWQSPADAGEWPFQIRGIEAEIALQLGEPVDAERAASLGVADARNLVQSLCVSIEIVDSRWAEANEAAPLAKLADLQSHGALVLGDWLPFVDEDWTAQICRVAITGQAVRIFRGTHSMGDPVFVVPAWLRHATRHGAVVPAGTVVTTGTWCGLLTANPGDEVQVSFDGLGHAAVTL